MQTLRNRLLFTGLILVVILPVNSVISWPWWLRGPVTFLVVLGMLLTLDRWGLRSGEHGHPGKYDNRANQPLAEGSFLEQQ